MRETWVLFGKQVLKRKAMVNQLQRGTCELRVPGSQCGGCAQDGDVITDMFWKDLLLRED